MRIKKFLPAQHFESTGRYALADAVFLVHEKLLLNLFFISGVLVLF
jgi:hypothetical protein